jgi:hypothetical protein
MVKGIWQKKTMQEAYKGKEMSGFYSLVLPFLFLFVLFFLQWTYSSPYARSWDEVDFALALERYDLLAMQPHFPGYPYFILGGMVLHHWVDDPVLALARFNVVMTALSSIPIYLLARKRLSPFLSGLLVVFIQTSSYLWVIQTQPMSEGTAIAILWWYFLSLQKAMDKRKLLYSILPLFFFGLLLGVRLSFLPFCIGLLCLWIYEWKEEGSPLGYWKKLTLYLIFGLMFQLIWVGGLILSEGSLSGFVELSLAFTSGHFNDWGGAVSASTIPIWERVVQLVFFNLLWVGLFGQSLWIALLMGMLFFLLMINRASSSKGAEVKVAFHSYIFWLSISLIGYFLWALFAQNIEKPRHISPLIGPILFLFFQSLLAQVKNRNRKRLALLLFILLTLAQFYQGLSLVKQQATEIPATYQLAYGMKEYQGEFTIYTWEETRVLEYLSVPYKHKRILTYDYFIEEIKQKQSHQIFITNRVLEGFERQVGELDHKVRQVTQFSSAPLFDPVYHHITVYEWIGGNKGAK